MESIADHPYAPKTVPRTVTLADGTVIDGTAALNTAADELWIRVWQDIKQSELSTLLEDPEKTEKITALYSQISSETFEGYTELDYVMKDRMTGELRARLVKPK